MNQSKLQALKIRNGQDLKKDYLKQVTTKTKMIKMFNS
jgi:hypothetical protein